MGHAAELPPEVLFWRSGKVLHASSIVFERGAVRDPKIGDVLQRGSRPLHAAILADHGSTFKLIHPYACDRAGGCRGEFVARTGPIHVSSGTPRRTYLTVWRDLPA